MTSTRPTDPRAGRRSPACGGNSGGPEVRPPPRRRSVAGSGAQLVWLSHFGPPGRPPAAGNAACSFTARTRRARAIGTSRQIGGLLLAAVAVLTADARLYAQAPAPADVDVATAPVEIDGQVLFRLRGVSSFPAEKRARLVTDRIVAAAADPALSVDSLRVVEQDAAAEIALGDEPLLRVFDADAALEQVGRAELARAHLSQVHQAIVGYRAARSRDARIRAAITTLVATLVLGLGIGLILWLWRRLDALMIRRMEQHVHTVGIQSFEVVRADQIRAALRNGVLGLRTVIILAGTLVYLGYLLSVWPSTRG